MELDFADLLERFSGLTGLDERSDALAPIVQAEEPMLDRNDSAPGLRRQARQGVEIRTQGYLADIDSWIQTDDLFAARYRERAQSVADARAGSYLVSERHNLLAGCQITSIAITRRKGKRTSSTSFSRVSIACVRS